VSHQAACRSDGPHDRWVGPPRNRGTTAPAPQRLAPSQ
jgi:hypothetical protein